MKKILSVTWLTMILFFNVEKAKSQAQNPSSMTQYHNVKILLTSGEEVKGTVSVNDSSILLDWNSPVHFRNIQTIKIRNPKAIIIGTAVGASIGLIGGLLLGKHEVFECPPNGPFFCGAIVAELDQAQDNALKASLGIIIGAGIGAAIGAGTEFNIAGQYSNFEKFKAAMEKKRMKRK